MPASSLAAARILLWSTPTWLSPLTKEIQSSRQACGSNNQMTSSRHIQEWYEHQDATANAGFCMDLAPALASFTADSASLASSCSASCARSLEAAMDLAAARAAPSIPDGTAQAAIAVEHLMSCA
jgi:hypothetical protein